MDTTKSLPYKIILPPKWFSFNIQEIITSRHLIWAFAKRELKIKYKHTLVGFLWVVIQPLIIIFILYGIIAKLQGNIKTSSLLGIFGGYWGWLWFSGPLSTSIAMFQNSENLIKKNAFPRIVIILAGTLVALIDIFIIGIIMTILAFFSGNSMNFMLFLYCLWIIIFSLGAALLLVSLNIRFRDVKHIFPFFLQVMFLGTPTFYEPPNLFYIINPIAIPVSLIKYDINKSPWSIEPMYMIVSIALCFITLIIGYFFFKRTEYYFADLL